MQIVIQPDGTIRCVYSETIDLTQLGTLAIRRGSHVEPNEQGQWTADLSQPISDPEAEAFGPHVIDWDELDANRNPLPDPSWLLG